MLSIDSLSIFLAISFLIYGFLCVRTTFMKREFERFRLKRFRVLTGFLELAAGLGLLVGLRFPILTVASSAGLSLLMLMGFLVRLKIKDSFSQSFPSFFFMILSFYIFYEAGTRYFQ